VKIAELGISLVEAQCQFVIVNNNTN